MSKLKSVTQIEDQDGTMVVRFAVERINDFALIRQVERELHDLLGRETCRRVVLDFSGLEYVVSEFFGVLLRVSREAKQRDRVLKGCQLGRFFQEIYEVMHFHQIIPIYETLEEALAS